MFVPSPQVFVLLGTLGRVKVDSYPSLYITSVVRVPSTLVDPHKWPSWRLLACSTCWHGQFKCTGERCKEECDEHEFRCDSGECIDSRYTCDGASNCADSSDERGCTGEYCGCKLSRTSEQLIRITWSSMSQHCHETRNTSFFNYTCTVAGLTNVDRFIAVSNPILLI